MVGRESVPDVAEASLQVLLKSHQFVLALAYLVPYTHDTLHLIVAVGERLLHQVAQHDVYHTVTLHVDDVALVQQLLAQQHPVLVGHTACEVEVTLQLTSLDVDLHVGIVGQVFLGIIELVEYIQSAWLVHYHHIEAGIESVCAACLVCTGCVAVLHHLELQGAVGAGLLINVDVDDIPRLAHDASGAGELAKGVSRTSIGSLVHAAVVTIYLIVVAHAEELFKVAAVAIVARIYLPGVVLHLLHHRLDGIGQDVVIGVGLQLLVGERLDVVLQSGAGFVLEEFGKSLVVGADVGLQVVEGVQLVASLLYELVGELYLLESPCAGHQSVGVPSHHVGCLVAVQTT